MAAKLNIEETIKFINLYRSKPILWDINEKSYKCFNLRNKAYEEIALEMGMEAESVRKKIRSLRCRYTREKRRTVKPYGEAAGKNCVSSLGWFNEMSFLDGPIAAKKRMDNSLKDESYSCNEEMVLSNISDSMSKNSISDKKSKIVPDYLHINSEEKNINIALLQLYKEKRCLWNYNLKVSRGKDSYQKEYESIATDINAKFSRNVSWLFVKNRINEMRFYCCNEIEKQLNGEKYQLPWYFEHIKFSRRYLRMVVRGRMRYKHKQSREIDESILLIVIELYEKHKELWQVNNVYFGIFSKRTETYKKMLEELKSDYNIKLELKHLKDYISYIHCTFSEDKERELKSELDKSDFSPASYHYEKLTFLKDSQGPFKCSHCNTFIKKFEEYHIHVAEHTNTMAFNCLLCENGFNKYHNYITHKEYHLKKDKGSYRCDICGKCFALKFQLNNHKQTHNYVCQICDASFRHTSAYDRHMHRHENSGRFECHICKLGFRQLLCLNNHIKSHLNVRDFVCNICNKGFISFRNLRNHKYVHNDEKRFKCDICGQKYARKSSLDCHRIRNHKLYARKIKREKEEPELE